MKLAALKIGQTVIASDDKADVLRLLDDEKKHARDEKYKAQITEFVTLLNKTDFGSFHAVKKLQNLFKSNMWDTAVREPISLMLKKALD